MSASVGFESKDVSVLTFEQAMSELVSITDLLEKGDVALDKAVQYYERASALQVYCYNKLKDAQLKVESIVQKNGVTTLEKVEDLEKIYDRDNHDKVNS